MTWKLDRIGYILWGITCITASGIVLFTRQRPNQGIWKLFIQYLLIHTTMSAVWLINDGLYGEKNETSSDRTTHKVLGWLINQLLLLAARIYFQLGTIIFRFRLVSVQRVLNIVSWVLLLISSVTLCVLSFAVTNFKQGSIIVYSFYCPCALYALVALYVCYCKLLRRDQSSSISHSAILSDLGIPESEETTCTCSGKTAQVVLMGVIGGTIGMIDFQLPALEYIGVSVWQSAFLGRLLDCVFYIPLIIPCLLWIDCPGNFPDPAM